MGGDKEELGVTSVVEVQHKEMRSLLGPGTQGPENTEVSCDQGREEPIGRGGRSGKQFTGVSKA